MSLRYGLLGLLNYGEGTGYELKKIFDDSINFFWQAHKSQIYKELTNLEKAGLLSVKTVIQEDRPNKKVYSLTESGREDFLNWLRADLNSTDFTVRDSFLVKVFFWGELEKEEALARLEEFIELQESKLKSYLPVDGTVDNYRREAGNYRALFWDFTLKQGIAYSRTCIEWARDAMEVLKKHENITD
ncbi:MAG: PadR family transcriptional regulator [Spirochaetales bacterium]|nr:PadR family transcriptional regulator [Spirochaetales bacterium]